MKPKSAVEYGSGTRHRNCSICRSYNRGDCLEVEGRVDPTAVCTLFTKR